MLEIESFRSFQCSSFSFRIENRRAELVASSPAVKIPKTVSSIRSQAFIFKDLRASLRSFSRRRSNICRFRIESSEKKWRTLEMDRGNECRCGCFVSLTGVKVVAARDMVSISDQLLLIASIFLTYLAGVVTRSRQSVSSARTISEDNFAAGDPSTGWVSHDATSSSSMSVWFTVKKKLVDSIDGLQRMEEMSYKDLISTQVHEKRPLGLYAISEGPRLRLLWATFQTLEEEVNAALGNFSTLSVDDWFKTFSNVIQSSGSPICNSWLSEELLLHDNASDNTIISVMATKLEEDNSLLQNMRNSGKEDLYREFIYFIKFGSVRKNSAFSSSLFLEYGDSILEDLVINVADAIATIYLDLISVDGKLFSQESNFGSGICSMSTRSLQKLRNEVALSRWLYQNLKAVESMYEDRFDMHSLTCNAFEDSNQDERHNFRWWRRIILGTPNASSRAFYYITINSESLPVKRTKELRALAGWRYYYSLYLELVDISLPFIRAIVAKIGNAVSFFLVSLIGRSLGLIYSGIRQSLRWK